MAGWEQGIVFGPDYFAIVANLRQSILDQKNEPERIEFASHTRILNVHITGIDRKEDDLTGNTFFLRGIVTDSLNERKYVLRKDSWYNTATGKGHFEMVPTYSQKE